MIDKKYLIGGLVGLIIGLSFIPIEASIPPTPSWEIFDVQTSSWFGTDTEVTADVYNDQVFFVSDGSIIFNVTETYP